MNEISNYFFGGILNADFWDGGSVPKLAKEFKNVFYCLFGFMKKLKGWKGLLTKDSFSEFVQVGC